MTRARNGAAEAGYVPGWRICLRGHHAQLSSDGRSAVVLLGGDETSAATIYAGLERAFGNALGTMHGPQELPS